MIYLLCLFSGIVHEYLKTKEDNATISSLGLNATFLVSNRLCYTLFIEMLL